MKQENLRKIILKEMEAKGMEVVLRVSKGSSSATIKVSKPDNITFYGKGRDFSIFKNDFESIIVPNRDKAQIELLFKQALPDRLKHLVSNLDLKDWGEMIRIIQEEVAMPKIIIDQITQEIDKLKILTTDKAFIEQVSNLEKIV